MVYGSSSFSSLSVALTHTLFAYVCRWLMFGRVEYDIKLQIEPLTDRTGSTKGGRGEKGKPGLSVREANDTGD